LWRPFTTTTSVIPDATASSTTSWIVGASTIGSISLGTARVAGQEAGAEAGGRDHCLAYLHRAATIAPGSVEPWRPIASIRRARAGSSWRAPPA
jgi:hypothetical protein